MEGGVEHVLIRHRGEEAVAGQEIHDESRHADLVLGNRDQRIGRDDGE